MRDSRSVCRIDAVHVERDIDGRMKSQVDIVAKVACLDHFNFETFDLFPLMSGGRTNAYLNQTIGQAFLHDACKRRCMRTRIALKVVIDVGMRIEVQDRQLREVPSNCAHERMRYRMVTAEENRSCALAQDCIYASVDEFPG